MREFFGAALTALGIVVLVGTIALGIYVAITGDGAWIAHPEALFPLLVIVGVALLWVGIAMYTWYEGDIDWEEYYRSRYPALAALERKKR